MYNLTFVSINQLLCSQKNVLLWFRLSVFLSERDRKSKQGSPYKLAAAGSRKEKNLEKIGGLKMGKRDRIRGKTKSVF